MSSRIASRKLWATSGHELGILAIFGATLFTSAFLLFSLQPIFAKMVLPKLGGSPAVWAVSTCFFQATLLAGYCYAHSIIRYLGVVRASITHIVLLLIAVLTLPFQLPPDVTPASDNAYLWLLGILGVSVGLPFFAVSANAPLLQAWFARSQHPHANDPYFLYGASNLGSLLALLLYPILIEPSLGLRQQADYWSVTFLLLIGTVSVCAFMVTRTSRSDLAADCRTASACRAPKLRGHHRLAWVGLSFVPSGLLVAFTSHISTDIASAPFLWVMPLAVFLLTFSLVFREKPLFPIKYLLRAQPILIAITLVGLALSGDVGWMLGAIAGSGAFFSTTMICHRYLYNIRPHSLHLTEFYLWMSLGGVIGGIFSALVAPHIFNSIHEYPLLLLLGMACRPGLLGNFRNAAPPEKAGIGFVLALGLGVIILPSILSNGQSERSFYGVHRIMTVDQGSVRLLVHGTTVHGAQRIRNTDGTPVMVPTPATYYYPDSPLAKGVQVARETSGKLAGGLSVGSVGLGVGSMSCHSRPNETWRFFEIDPAVVNIATNPQLFSFLSHCRPNADIVVGDARLTLSNESDAAFDYLILDAFSSDSVPVHLLTREAIRLYLSKLAPNGILALHISNRHMDLASVTAATALSIPGTWAELVKSSPPDPGFDRMPNHVMFLTKSPAVLSRLRAAIQSTPVPKSDFRPWTDDYSNVALAIWSAFGRN